jgi:hypothetical protein
MSLESPYQQIGSGKVVYESAFECGADRLAWDGAVHFVNISQNQARCSTAGRRLLSALAIVCQK